MKYGYAVDMNRYCELDEYENESGGPYCHSWHTSYSNSFKSIGRTDTYPDVTSVHDFADGDIAYLVWAEWGSGDSFGYGDGITTESFGLFNEAKDAYSLQYALDNASKNKMAKKWEGQYCFSWKSSEGEKLKVLSYLG